MTNEELLKEYATSAKGSPERRRLCAAIVEQNRGLIGMCVSRWCKRQRITSDADWDVTESDAYMGILRAIDAFDIERGFKFSTYATNVILRYVYQCHEKREHLKVKNRVRIIYTDEKMQHGAKEVSRNELTIRHINSIMRNRSGGLTDMDAEVLRDRFENIGTPKTLEEVGFRIGLSRQGVLNLQNAAIKKIRLRLEYCE